MYFKLYQCEEVGPELGQSDHFPSRQPRSTAALVGVGGLGGLGGRDFTHGEGGLGGGGKCSFRKGEIKYLKIHGHTTVGHSIIFICTN